MVAAMLFQLRLYKEYVRNFIYIDSRYISMID